NDVAFDPDYDRDASGHHAELRNEGGAWVIVDLGSKNGTFVRGQRVDRLAVAGGEEITFGAKGPRVRIDFTAAPADAPKAPAPKPAPAPARPEPRPSAGSMPVLGHGPSGAFPAVSARPAPEPYAP